MPMKEIFDMQRNTCGRKTVHVGFRLGLPSGVTGAFSTVNDCGVLVFIRRMRNKDKRECDCG